VDIIFNIINIIDKLIEMIVCQIFQSKILIYILT